MLEIGNGGMNHDEYKTHMSLWSILAAPLLAGNDLRDVPPSIMAILTNQDVVAIDQDRDGKQGVRVWQSGDQEVWVRELAGGDRAVAVFNRAAAPVTLALKWAHLGMKAPSGGRDLWTAKDERFEGAGQAANIPAHGVVLWRVHPASK
jgi:alpha-galactosidase